MKHDEVRYKEFIQRAVSGEETIHSATLFPYDIVEKVLEMTWRGVKVKEDDVLEAQWRQLPDYVEPGTNALVIASATVQAFGTWSGSAVGSDGTEYRLDGLVGWAEQARNRW